VWWDDLDMTTRAHQQSCSFQHYWTVRRARRGGQRLISPLHPVLDKRLTSVSKVKLLRSDGEIFRAKLWWDHLPSQGVRARGCTTEAQDAMQCDFCTRKCAGSTWHIMAECPATHLLLLEARKTGSEQLQELASQV